MRIIQLMQSKLNRNKMRKINKILLHCSASDLKKDDDIKAIKHLHVSKKDVKINWGKYNTHGKSFKDVGYHYFIRKDGLIQKGRDIMQVGAHCKGQNSASIGICLSGRHKFTEYQFIALERLISGLNIRLPKNPTIHPHNEFSDKSCPNFSVQEFILNYLD